MSEIQYTGSGELYITNITEARTIEKDQFDRIITVCQDSIEDNVPDSCEYRFYEMSDGPDNTYGGDHSYDLFKIAADSLYEGLEDGEKVLIHCHAGQSRSVSVATATLGRLLDMPLNEALELIHRYRIPHHYPDDLLLEHATQYIEEHDN